MHREKATSPACVVAVAEVVVEEVRFATPAEFPPPQPAANTENAATATTAVTMNGGRRRTISVPFGRQQGKLTIAV
jgi:hypothetical protein